MFTVICDNCQKDAGDHSHSSCYQDDETAEENALEDDWVRNGTRHYCKECIDYYNKELNIKDL